MGVYRPDLTETMAQVLGRLGAGAPLWFTARTKRPGYDEITITGPIQDDPAPPGAGCPDRVHHHPRAIRA